MTVEAPWSPVSRRAPLPAVMARTMIPRDSWALAMTAFLSPFAGLGLKRSLEPRLYRRGIPRGLAGPDGFLESALFS